MLSHAQREARRSCIGGSDWASILGIEGAYSTPLEVWRSKVEPLEDEPSTYAQERGDALEPFVVRWFGRETGRDVVVNPKVGSGEHTLPSWWQCQIDAMVYEDLAAIPLEAKTATVRKRGEWGESGTDQVPLRYVVQVMAQIAYLGATHGYLAVDIGGDEFRNYRIERDDRLIAHMLAKGTEFWHLVETKTPPAPTSSAEANLVWSTHEPGEYLEADGQAQALLRAIAEHKAEEKRRAELREKLELELKSMLQHREGLKLGDRVLCTWKTQESARVDTAALKREQPALAAKYLKVSTTRVLRVKEQGDE